MEPYVRVKLMAAGQVGLNTARTSRTAASGGTGVSCKPANAARGPHPAWRADEGNMLLLQPCTEHDEDERLRQHEEEERERAKRRAERAEAAAAGGGGGGPGGGSSADDDDDDDDDNDGGGGSGGGDDDDDECCSVVRSTTLTTLQTMPLQARQNAWLPGPLTSPAPPAAALYPSTGIITEAE